ncbi:DUF4062 domain-containing protein [uncultured Methanoregula sp.]|uniref:DUF4062 domain-containing protein n=1 Tax=uncultured Methanoregula sp. TaxID=1005933 RepID=UPI002AAA8200|nr:DUF4062 domain-containing protein [uncultured Methanoregula sp.]
MSTSWQTVSVFISSTFNDMHAERDYLVKRVFPELREWCGKRKLRLVDIDLRWGVTEEDATRHKNVVKVCLDRIDACRPFFLCFLGQRRGWVPDKGDVSKETCETYNDLKDWLGNVSVTELEILHAAINPLNDKDRAQYSFFYLRDDSYLKDLPVDPPLTRKTYTNESILDQNERELANRELKSWRDEKIPAINRPVHRYFATWNVNESTPELRIPLQCPSSSLPNQEQWRKIWKTEAGIDVPDLDIENDPELTRWALEFNESLSRGRLGNFTSEGKPLSEIILDDLKRAIEERYPDHREIPEESGLQIELDQQEQFLQLNLDGFIERTGDFDALDAYADGDSRNLFVLTAPGGMGKTMLLANWINHHQRKNDGKDLSLFYRFIGASDRSTTVDSVIRHLLREMKENAGLFDDEIVAEPEELRVAWPAILEKVGNQQKTIIVIDGVNQLESGLTDLRWVPHKLPHGIKLIISFKRDGDDAEKICKQFAGSTSVILAEVKPFTNADDKKALITAYLGQFLKELDNARIAELIAVPGAMNPLFLKIVLSELRVFGAFTNLGDKIRDDFGTTPMSAFSAVLRRLENDPSYSTVDPRIAVPLLFGLLSHARYGLSEEELIDLFQQEFNQKKTPGAKEDSKDTIRLILRQVRSFLALRVGRFDFFYESFRIASIHRYEVDDKKQNGRVSSYWHRSLADYFENLPVWISEKENLPTIRRAAELPYHLAWAGKEDHLADLILEYELIESIVFGIGPQEAIEDISFILSPLAQYENEAAPGKMNAIKLIQSGISLSAHVLMQNPNQLPSQLVGRLLGSENPVIMEFIGRLNRFNRYAWLRPITPAFTQPGGSLVRTLNDSTCYVQSLAVTNNGRWAVSGSYNTLKAWDLMTGTCLRTMECDSPIHAISVTQDGQIAITGSDDHTLRVWELVTGIQIKKLVGHTGWVNVVAVTEDGNRAISGSADKTMRVWDLKSGQLVYTFTGHTGAVKTVAVTIDGKIAISGSEIHESKTVDIDKIITGQAGFQNFSINKGALKAVFVTRNGYRAISESEDKSLMLWDVETRQKLAHLVGVTPLTLDIIITSDDLRAISASSENSLKVWDIKTGQVLIDLLGHTKEVTSVTMTPDNRLIVSGSSDKTLKVWDLDTGRALESFDNNSSGVTSVAITPDGQFVISGLNDGTLNVWDRATGECVWTNVGHTNAILAVAVTLDGRRVISGSEDKTIKVWDRKSGRVLFTFNGHSDKIISIAITPDCRRAISGSADTTLKVWDLIDGEEIITLVGHEDWVTEVAVTHDSRYAISGSRDNTIRTWNLETGEELASYTNTGDVLNKTSEIKNKKIDIPDKGTSPLKVWNLETGKCIKSLTGHTADIIAVGITHNSQQAISISFDKIVKIWDLKSFQNLATLKCKDDDDDDSILCIASSKDGDLYFSGSRAGFLKGYDKYSGEIFCKKYSSMIKTVTLTPDEKKVVFGMNDNTLKVWDLITDQELASLTGHANHVNAVAVTPDGSQIISGSSDNTLKVWDLGTYHELASLKGHANHVNAVAVTPDGSQVISGSSDNTLKVWDLGTYHELASLTGHANHVNAVAVTPDGSQVISGSSDNTLKVWDLGTYHELASLTGHANHVNAIAVTPDGSQVISGSSDNTLKVWDLGTYHELASLTGHADHVNAVAVTPDGSQVISGSSDNTLKVWDLKNFRMYNYEIPERMNVSVALAPDGQLALFYQQYQGISQVWNFSRGSHSLNLDSGTDGFVTVAITSDGHHAVSASDNLKVWDLSEGLRDQNDQGTHHFVTDLAITADGRFTISGSWDNTIKIWDIMTGECIKTLKGHREGIKVIALTADGRSVVSISMSSTIKVWDLMTGVCKQTWNTKTDNVKKSPWETYFAITPDGQLAVSGCCDELKVWDISTGMCLSTKSYLRVIPHNKADDFDLTPFLTIDAVAISFDGKFVVWGLEGRLKIWDLTTGMCVSRERTRHTEKISVIAFTPDGKFVLSGSRDNTIKIWTIETGTCTRTLIGHLDGINYIAITPDGQFAVSASLDKTLKVWDLATGTCKRTMVGHEREIIIVRITPDGKFIISVARDSFLKIWDFKTGKCLITFYGEENYSGCCISDTFTIVTGGEKGVTILRPEGIVPEIPFVTAVERKGDKLSAKCIFCQEISDITKANIRDNFICPVCGGLMKVNVFVSKKHRDSQYSLKHFLPLVSEEIVN